MQPIEFVNKWANTALGELQSGQAHFLDVCRLLDLEMPGGDGRTETGETFVFEQPLQKASGHGRADVYYENHFAIEYKGADKYPDLNAAYQQLLQYRENLNNPPLLVVTDINHWEIHTNFPNTQKRVYAFGHRQIASDPQVRAWLDAMFRDPMRLHPRRNTEQVTKEAAAAFQLIADNMRDWDAEPTRIAYFLTKLVFCLFAEDVGLLPTAVDSPRGIFTHIIEQARGKPAVFKQYVRNLFVAMNEGGNILMRDIPYFNGTLFHVVTVEELSVEALEALAEAAKLNWAAIEPSIFGTLFERSLDPGKRAQLGAHYTSRDDILLIIEPVLMQPLRYQWDTAQLEAAPIRERYDNARTGRAKTNARVQLLAKRAAMLKGIRETTVLDPACGSGNFLYIALQALMDLEKEVIQHPLWAGLQMATREVHPRQMYGIEINPIAQALASIVVWIGYIQWRINNGYGQEFGEPILEELEDNIARKDAILPPLTTNPIPRPLPQQAREGELGEGESRRGDSVSRPQTETVNWPAVDVIVGNPPFLGAKKQRIELGDEYVDRLREYYKGRIPAFVDFACYWFEKAREQIANGKAKRAGLLATNSIRDGTSRHVLQRIKETGDIFMAWSDREWVLDGAAVRISMIGFDRGLETEKTLDGVPVKTIHSNLTSKIDVTNAIELAENKRISFLGPQKDGPLDIPFDLAIDMLKSSNRSGVDNRNVVKPYRNSVDLVRTLRNFYIIDFYGMSLEEAREYEAPFKYVEETVKPVRERNRERQRRDNWWRLGRSGDDYRKAVRTNSRQIFTPLTSKHRIFVWEDIAVFPGSTTVAFARDDDYFFGVLHSKPHEVWALRKAKSLGLTPRYTPTTTFETFPFPWSPGAEDKSHPAHAAISAAAAQLHEERDAWLNPADDSRRGDCRSVSTRPVSRPPAALKDRTLTNLYNALQVFRGRDSMKVKSAAADFAPRLDELHRALDEAVCDAYGWGYAVLGDEEEILRRLLALNLARAAQSD